MKVRLRYRLRKQALKECSQEAPVSIPVQLLPLFEELRHDKLKVKKLFELLNAQGGTSTANRLNQMLQNAHTVISNEENAYFIETKRAKRLDMHSKNLLALHFFFFKEQTIFQNNLQQLNYNRKNAFRKKFAELCLLSQTLFIAKFFSASNGVLGFWGDRKSVV